MRHEGGREVHPKNPLLRVMLSGLVDTTREHYQIFTRQVTVRAVNRCGWFAL